MSTALERARRDYILQPGDVAQVTIYRGNSVAPEYRQEVTVQPDGKITLINIEEPIDTTGMTVARLQEKVKEVYEPEFGIDPGAPGRKFEATVQFISSTKTQWLPDQVFVTGEVRRPLSLPYRRGLTVMKAISEAAGWRYTADESRIVILRMGPDGKSVARQIDCAAVAVHEAEDIVLFPGDVVFVPLSGIAKVNLFVEFYIRGLLPFNPSILRTFAFSGFSG
jgi:protein involved in polysaccharide export with SLBB domain